MMSGFVCTPWVFLSLSVTLGTEAMPQEQPKDVLSTGDGEQSQCYINYLFCLVCYLLDRC